MAAQIYQQLPQQSNYGQIYFPVPNAAVHPQNMNGNVSTENKKKPLDLMYLCSLAEYCESYRRLIIPEKLFFAECNGYFEVTLGKYVHKTYSYSDIERIFKIFGKWLTDVLVSFNPARDDPFVFNLVEQYCNSELKSLSITNLSISKVFVEKLKPIFERLKTLHMWRVSVEDKSLFTGLNSLVELQVNQVYDCATILQNVFPRLKRFTYQNCKVVMVNSIWNPHEELLMETFDNAFSRYSFLKKLNIHFYVTDQKCWMPIMQTIGNCSELEELRMSNINWYSSGFLKPLQRLMYLQTLELWLVSFDDFLVFAPLTKLSKLVLNTCTVPRYFDYLHRLTKLRLRNCEYESMQALDVVDIIRQLATLTELEICDSRILINAQQFSDILTIVKRRKVALNLICDADFEVKESGVYKNVYLLSPHFYNFWKYVNKLKGTGQRVDKRRISGAEKLETKKKLQRKPKRTKKN